MLKGIHCQLVQFDFAEYLANGHIVPLLPFLFRIKHCGCADLKTHVIRGVTMGATTGGLGGPDLPKFWTDPQLFT